MRFNKAQTIVDTYAWTETVSRVILPSEQNNTTTRLAKCICGCSPVMFFDQSAPALCKVRQGLTEAHVQCPPFLSVPE